MKLNTVIHGVCFFICLMLAEQTFAQENTVTELTSREKEAKFFIKNVLNWRKTAKAVHHGKLMHFAPENGFYVYFRYTDSHKVMVILNKNDGDVTLDLTRFRQILDAGKKGKDIISGKTIVLNREIQVPAHTPMIIDMQ